MKHSILICVFIMFISGCASKGAEDDETLVKIGDYKLTTGEFQKLFVEELAFDESFKPTRQAREEFLENLIRKELLIQEAVKQKLDRKEAFMRAIERYWEATLIKELLEKKNKEIQNIAYVTQEEIEQEYARLKQQGDISLPLSECEDDIRARLIQEKKQDLIEKWISDLRDSAQLTVNNIYLEKGSL